MKLSKVLRAIGRGAVIAAQFTPAGSAVTAGLGVAGKVLHQPEGVEDDAPETLREVAVETVLANAGSIIAAAIATRKHECELAILIALGDSANAVEKWLQDEQQLAAEKVSHDGR
jgi:hypothetical protein